VPSSLLLHDEDASRWYHEVRGQGPASTFIGGSFSPEVVVTPAGFAPFGVRQVRGIVRVA